MSESKVSFTIRRPSPVSRVSSTFSSNVPSPAPHPPTPAESPAHFQPHADSSDEDAELQDELVSSFDKFGVQRLHPKFKKPQGPLVIPALENRDWKEVARKRKAAARFVPPSAAASTGADGSVGGLGTKDTINSGPVRSGLQVKERQIKVEQDVAQDSDGDVDMQEDVKVEEAETDDQRALRALLAESSGEVLTGPTIDIIPTPVSEAEAFKQDVEELPDAASLEDYERVPVSQFGAALLRGMGWKEGTAASRKPGKGLVEPYFPAARPALLGIGAKEMEVFDDGSKGKKKFTNSRKPGKYMPLIRQEREGTSTPVSRTRDRSRSPARSGSRRSSKSPDRKDRDRDARTRDSRRDRDYDRDYESKDRDRQRDRAKDDERERYRGSDRDRDRKYDGRDKRYADGEKDRRRDEDNDRRRNRSRERRRDY